MGRSSNQRSKIKSKNQRSQFTLFYIITLLAGVIICIVIFAIVFSNITKNRADASPQPSGMLPSASPGPAEGSLSELKQRIGFITNIDFGKSALTMVDVETEKNFTVAADAGTSLKNKYGQEIAFSELAVGDIVNINYDAKTETLQSIAQDSTAWEFKLVRNVKVSPEQQVINLSNKYYFYNNQLMAVYKNAPIDPSAVSEADVVTLRGYEDTAWYMEVNKSHGYVELKNKDKVKDGTLEIDTTIFMTLDEADKVEVLEGAHRIVIKGANIEPFVTDVVITTENTEVLDLADVQFMSGIVNVKSNVSDFQLFVDGKEYPATEPLVLQLGTYKLEAKKTGYLPFSTTITVAEPTMDVNVMLSEEVVLRTLTVTTVPEGAELYIDNGYVGVTPVSDSLPDGRHTITVRKAGYNDTTMTIDVNANARLSYSFILQALTPYTPTPSTPVPPFTPDLANQADGPVIP